MPTIPTSADMTRVMPSPNTNVASYEDRTGAALSQAGHSTLMAGNLITDEANRLANLRATNALVELRRQHNYLQVGEHGYANLKNEDAFAPGVRDKYLGAHKAVVEQLGSKLDRSARARFEQLANREGAEFEAGYLSHAARQVDSFKGVVFSSAVDEGVERMALMSRDPEGMMRARAHLKEVVAARGNEQGIERNVAAMQQLTQEVFTPAHAAVIESYLKDGDAASAQAYLQHVSHEISTPGLRALNNMMKPEIAMATARTISAELFDMYKGGKSAEEINNRKLELTEGKSLDVMRLTEKLHGDNLDASQHDDQVAVGAVMMRGGGLSSPEMRSLAIRNPLLYQKARAQMMSGGADGGGGGVDMGLYARMYEGIGTNPQKYTPETIYSHVGAGLTRAMADKLTTELKSAGKEVARYQLPKALVDEGRPPSAKKTEDFNKYKGHLYVALDQWKRANPGKTPTTEEAKALVRDARADYAVPRGTFLGLDMGTSKSEAWELQQGEGYPIQFGDMPETQGLSHAEKAKAFAFVRKAVADTRNDPRPLDTRSALEVYKKYKDQLE